MDSNIAGMVGVKVGVFVGVLVVVFVGVLVGVFVVVLVGVSVVVLVGVFVGVLVGVLVGVSVGVFVCVLVGVLVEVGVTVGPTTVCVFPLIVDPKIKAVVPVLIPAATIEDGLMVFKKVSPPFALRLNTSSSVWGAPSGTVKFVSPLKVITPPEKLPLAIGVGVVVTVV